MKTGSFFLLLLVSLTCCFFTGCQPTSDSSTASSAAATPLRIAYSNKVCYEPFIIAVAKGFFEEEGVRVEPRLVNGGILAAESLITGSADLAAMGDAPFLLAAAKSSKIKLLTRYGGGSRMHRLISRIDITDIRQLEHARIGIQRGSSTHGAFLAWSEQMNLDLSRIEIVALSPSDMPQALLTGQIDAMAGSEPWPSHVEMLCGDRVHELADFSALGNDFPLVIAVADNIILSREQEIQAVLRALGRAIDYMRQSPVDAVSLLSGIIGLPEQQQEKCTFSLCWNIGFDDNDRDSMIKTAQVLRRLGSLDQMPPISALAGVAGGPLNCNLEVTK